MYSSPPIEKEFGRSLRICALQELRNVYKQLTNGMLTIGSKCALDHSPCTGPGFLRVRSINTTFKSVTPFASLSHPPPSAFISPPQSDRWRCITRAILTDEYLGVNFHDEYESNVFTSANPSYGKKSALSALMDVARQVVDVSGSSVMRESINISASDNSLRRSETEFLYRRFQKGFGVFCFWCVSVFCCVTALMK